MTKHLAREQLLNYLDGELSKTEMRAAAAHIQSCWACRTELEHLEEDIGLIHDALKEVLLPGLPPPPRPWPRLEPRLASVQRPGLLHLLRASITINLVPRPVPLLTVLAGLLAVVVLVWFSPPTVSANEILRRVSEADARRMIAPPDHFIRQKIQVTRTQRGSTSKERGQVESWRSGKSAYWRIAQNDMAALSLQRRYQAKKVADLPLSSVSYQSWSNGAVSEGQVTRAAGALDVKFVALGVARPGDLESVTLVVRTNDWHVTQMELDFADGRFEVAEESLTVLARSEVPAEVLSELEPPVHSPEPRPLVARAIAPTSPASPQAPNLDDIEMDVRYMLHEIGGDLGEPIEVVTDPAGQVVVRAYAIPRARQEILRQLLQDKAEVRLELEPPERKTEDAGITALVLEPVTPVTDTARLANHERLAKWFGSAQAQEDFTRSVLANSTDLLARLYALKQLADRWPAGPASSFSEESKAKLATMIQENASAAAQRCTELKLMVKPLLEEFARADQESSHVSVHRDWQDSAAIALEAAMDVDRLLRSIFTTTAESTSLDVGFPRFRQDLREVEQQTAALIVSKP
jgi:hypothetical protein